MTSWWLQVVTVTADLAKLEDLNGVISEAITAFGQLDVLVSVTLCDFVYAWDGGMCVYVCVCVCVCVCARAYVC